MFKIWKLNICPNHKMYFSKLKKVFVQIMNCIFPYYTIVLVNGHHCISICQLVTEVAKYICQNYKKMFVQNWKYIFSNYELYFPYYKIILGNGRHCISICQLVTQAAFPWSARTFSTHVKAIKKMILILITIIILLTFPFGYDLSSKLGGIRCTPASI